MVDSDNKFTWMTQKSLIYGAKLSLFVAAGLFGTQAAMGQTDADSLVAPQPPELLAPSAVEPVTPVNIVPSSIDTTSTGTDYGTVFVEPNGTLQTPTLESLRDGQTANETPNVEMISPADYGAGLVDRTDFGVGATMPELVFSERSSGCEFAVQAGDNVAGAACRQISQFAASTVGGLMPGRSSQGNSSGAANFSIPGLPLAGGTTTASREYYNQAARAVVELQLGETFIFPLTIPASITSLFGWRIHPIFGQRRFHTGTDLGAPLGTPVVATKDGRVTLSDYVGGYGLTVMLRHNDGQLESRYAHLSRLLVQSGEWVKQGEVIGLVGSTGNSTGPHLHFEIRQLTATGWVLMNSDTLIKSSLGTFAQALNNPLGALSGALKLETLSAAEVQDLPFRPAQPHAN